jgi:hypothetical protein
MLEFVHCRKEAIQIRHCMCVHCRGVSGSSKPHRRKVRAPTILPALWPDTFHGMSPMADDPGELKKAVERTSDEKGALSGTAAQAVAAALLTSRCTTMSVNWRA